MIRIPYGATFLEMEPTGVLEVLESTVQESVLPENEYALVGRGRGPPGGRPPRGGLWAGRWTRP
jgi:hypothetical protein